MVKPTAINIGNTDENADWIKSLPGHKDEVAIHEALAKKYGKKAAKKPVPKGKKK